MPISGSIGTTPSSSTRFSRHGGLQADGRRAREPDRHWLVGDFRRPLGHAASDPWAVGPAASSSTRRPAKHAVQVLGPDIPGHSPHTAFLAFLLVEPQTHFRCVTSISTTDFATALAGWRINGEVPHFMAIAAAKNVHMLARCICSVDPWPAPILPPSAAAALPTHSPLVNGSVLLNTVVVKMEEVVGPPGNVEQITMMLDSAYLACRAEYNRVMETFPPEDKDITPQQLSALSYLLENLRPPYADFACFGKHGARIMKKQALQGTYLDATGALRRFEIFGPPTVYAWGECFDVLSTGLIMKKAVSRPVLEAYRDFIFAMAKMFGSGTWPLLYQAEVRNRSERFPVLRARALTQHNASLLAQRPSDFDIDRPWNTVFAMCIEEIASGSWWRKE